MTVDIEQNSGWYTPNHQLVISDGFQFSSTRSSSDLTVLDTLGHLPGLTWAMYLAAHDVQEHTLTVEHESGSRFALSSLWAGSAYGDADIVRIEGFLAGSSTGVQSNGLAGSRVGENIALDPSIFRNVDRVEITIRPLGIDTPHMLFDLFVFNPAVAPPTVSDAHISISGASGTGGVFKVDDLATATWNNTASGDNNSGITGVTVDFSQFGGGAAVMATNNGNTWTATYMISAGAIEAADRNILVTAINAHGATTNVGTTNARVDNLAPTVLGIAPASGALPSHDAVDFLVDFSEAVSNVSTDDFSLAGAPMPGAVISGVSVSGTTASVTVSNLSGSGNLRLDLMASTDIVDAAGNPVAAYDTGATHTVNRVTVPDAPVIGSVVARPGEVEVFFAVPANTGGSPIIGYTVTSNPGGDTATGVGSPISVVGLINGLGYTFTVTAHNAAGTGAASAASALVTPKEAQFITFNNPGAQTYGSSPDLSLIAGGAHASSGLALTYRSNTTGICTINTQGRLTFVGVGSCTISTEQAGNSGYLPASPVVQTFTVQAVPPDAPTNVSAQAGDRQAVISFSVPANNGGSAITSYLVSASPADVAPVLGTGSPITVTGLTNGQSYTFTVSAENTAGNGPASVATGSIQVAASQTITFVSPGALAFGTRPTLAATTDSGLAPAFSTATPAVCSITAAGLLDFLSTGTCTIDVDQAGNASYLPATRVSGSFQVNAVAPGVPLITAATVAGHDAVEVAFTAPANAGGEAIASYTVTASPGDLKQTGSSSPIRISGLTPGTAYTFTVAASNSKGSGLVSTPSISVTPAPAVVAAPVSMTVAYGAPATAVLLDIQGTPTSVAVMSPPAHGVVSVTGAGIRYAPAASYVGSDSFSYIASDAYSTSAPAVVSIVVLPPDVRVDTPALAVASLGVAYTQAVSSSGGSAPYAYALARGALPAGLALSASGELSGTPTQAGTFSIEIQATDSSTGSGPFAATAAYTLTVEAGQQQITAFVATPAEPLYVQGGSFAVAATGGGSGNPVRFASTTAEVCTVSATTVMMKAAGSCRLTADQDGNARYRAAAQASLEVVIARALPQLSWPDALDKVEGAAAFELPVPASNSDGAFTYTSSNPAVATVTGRQVSVVGAGVTMLVASQAASANHVAASVQLQLTVSARPDPTRDAQVRGGLQAQIDASARFAQAQAGNIQSRLRHLRTGSNASNVDFALAYAGSRGVPGLTLPVGRVADAVMPSLPAGWGMWLAGTATFGSAGRQGRAGGGFEFNTGGISLGADRALGDDLLLGLATSWGSQGTDFAGTSSRLDADQRSLAAYGLWRLGEHLFVDGLLANGQLDLDLTRWSEVASANAYGVREGEQWFGGLTMGYEHRANEGLTLTGYGRYDVQRSRLDAYREHGLGQFDLVYDRQVVDSRALAVGLEGSHTLLGQRSRWRPFWGVEYRQSLDSHGDVSMNYVQGPRAGDYLLSMRSYNDDLLSLEAGMDLQLDSGWMFSLSLGREQGRNRLRSSSIGLSVRYGQSAASVPMYGEVPGQALPGSERTACTPVSVRCSASPEPLR